MDFILLTWQCAGATDFRCCISAMLSNMSLRYLLCLISITSASALYFHIGETEKKCFIEEIPDETMVVGKWQTLD